MKKSEAVYLTARLFDELNNIVCDWDPFGLSKQGEIGDEFSGEVWELLKLMPKLQTEEQVIGAIQEIFSGLFPENELSIEVCNQTGRKIFQWWQQIEA